jgi:EAL domain-containing protein (putative c-di-GMP-specific phosphodiesterase class I)
MRRTVWTELRGLDEFDRMLATRDVEVAFQPIVDLQTRETVGFEGLARPPVGSSYAGPADLFAEAYRRKRVGELDWVCRGAVFEAALTRKLPFEVPLFLNVEPAAMNAPCPADLLGLFAKAIQVGRYVVEITERAMTDDPARLMAAVDRTRDVRIGVALDDIGADPAGLALLPLVAPDIIKLDLSLLQGRPTPEIARVVNVVRAQAERTGALVVAEGVESERHVATARAMGASLGQGWLFGRPGKLPEEIEVPQSPLPTFAPPSTPVDSPFALVAQARTPVVTARELLAATSVYLEDEVRHSSGRAMLMSCFQVCENVTPAIRRRYERLAAQTALTVALGVGMSSQPVRGVRGADLHPDDPLCREWTVVVLDSHHAAALVARRVDDSAPTAPGRFEAVVTYDRDTVLAAARSLLSRVPPLG